MIPNIKLLKIEGVKQPVGRRSVYSEMLADTICDRIAEGESLRAVCLSVGMPSKGTVMRWLDDGGHTYFRESYAFACWWRGQMLLDEILEIADDSSKDIIYDASGRARPNWTAIKRAKLRIEVRQWLYSVTAPKKYGIALVNAFKSVQLIDFGRSLSAEAS